MYMRISWEATKSKNTQKTQSLKKIKKVSQKVSMEVFLLEAVNKKKQKKPIPSIYI